MKFRDCAWCGLTHGQMLPFVLNQEVGVAGKPPRYYAILACPSCGGITVIETNAPNQQPVVFAVEPRNPRNVAEEIDSLPDDVRQYFSDAAKVLRAGVPDAAAVQLRRTIEAAIAHYNVDERVLVKGIERLIDDGHVTKAFGGALHHIRKVGNAGAHASDERLDDATVRPAFEFTAALLRDLFEVPARLKEINGAPGEK